METKETIVAIATSTAEQGSIGIVKASGKDALSIAKKFFVPKKKCSFTSHKFYYGNIVDKKKVIDEVLFVYMKAPNSYTKENVVEIHTHSNTIVLQKVISLFVDRGARIAEKGEFTKRAFLNGRIDLTQAEAIIDIINAKNEKSLEIATKQLSGENKLSINRLKKILFDFLTLFETAIDFPEDFEEEINFNTIKKKIDKELIPTLQDSLENYKAFCFLKKEINISLIGEPNAGKSSLLNALLKEDRAIVTKEAGTTRDLIKETIVLNGLIFKIIDTAGITKTTNFIEKIGIKKAKETALASDLILFVIDSSLKEPVKKLFYTLFKKNDSKVLFVFNKTDKITKEKEALLGKKAGSFPFVKVSALKKTGLEKIKEYIFNNFKEVKQKTSELIITNLRQKNSIENALKNILSLKNNIENRDVPFEIISFDIQNAINNLNAVLGQNIKEDVLDEIFKNFCIGK